MILAALAAASLGGCLHPVDTANAPTFGDAHAAMIAAQVNPSSPTDEAPEGSGAVGARAVDTYANNPQAAAPTVNLNIDTTN
ncbi:MAG: hypothetical protein NW206_01585 [Hyphomonadaceae bacterium]|nr:hypothetical protein [Hyphomonadaceae bacterium]